MIFLDSNPICQHRSLLDFLSGPTCGKPAKWLSCDYGLPACDEHKCRCKISIMTELEYTTLKLENAKQKLIQAQIEIERAQKELNEIKNRT